MYQNALNSISIALLSIFLFSCAQTLEKVAKKPQVTYDSFRMGKATKESLTLIPKIQVLNTNNYPIPVDALTYSLSLNNNNVFSGENKSIGKLESKKPKGVELPVILTQDTLKLFKEKLFKDGKIDYGVSGNVKILGFKLPFEKKDTLYLPVVKIGKIEIGEVSLSKVSLKLPISISNDNNFALPVQGISYVVNHKGKGIVTNSTKIGGIAKKSKKEIILPLEISPKNLGFTLFSLVTNPTLALDVQAMVDVGFHKVPLNRDINLNLRKLLN
jgi:LEA14-like dessication related protein